jgi:hypothetical protein
VTHLQVARLSLPHVAYLGRRLPAQASQILAGGYRIRYGGNGLLQNLPGGGRNAAERPSTANDTAHGGVPG